MRFLFDDLCLDANRRELLRRGELVRVEPQVFDLLEFLVRNRDRLVTRDDLIASVWDGRIVSESALATRINAARSAIGDDGERQRLIKTIPRKGLRFVGTVREDPAAHGYSGAAEPPPSLPDKPSIAVLPFASLSGDPAQDYFTDAIVDGVINGLCRIRWLFVIARNSSFTYKGRAVDVKQVGRELGVRYVLEGGVQKIGNRVRITTQLVDATTGAHLSADRFDGTLDDIFDLQDEAAASVVGAIAPRLERAEIDRARRKPTASLDAYDIYLRGKAAAYPGTRDAFDEALRLFTQAFGIDADFAAAYAAAALCHAVRPANGWVTAGESTVAEGMRLTRRAVALSGDDAEVLAVAGHAVSRLAGELEAGAELIDRALALDPNSAQAWTWGGWIKVWRGEADDAIAWFARAMRLSPLDPRQHVMQAGTASAHFVAGRYEEARQFAERAVRGQPNSGPALRVAAASLALTGRSEAGRGMLAALRVSDPGLCLANLHERAPWAPEPLARLAAGLLMAGLPERS